MPEDGPGMRRVFDSSYKEKREEANAQAIGIVDGVEGLIKAYRQDAAALRAGITSTVLAAVGVAAALSLIPFESNFGSHFAGSVMRDLASPGVAKAINAPISDYLDNIFPTGELNVRMLVTGLENGALTDTDIVETAVDAGIKDAEIMKLLKIAKVLRFEKETKDDYSMIARYEDAIISSQIADGKADIDDAIAMRNERIKELTLQLEREAVEVT